MKTTSFAAFALLATLAATGCSVASAEDGSDEQAQSTEKSRDAVDRAPLRASADGTLLRASPGANCSDIGGGRFVCKNMYKRPAGYGGFTMVDNLDAWGNQKVIVTNTGKVKVTVASQQGLNVIRQQTDLAPGASVTLERVDAITPFWSILIFTDEPIGAAEITCDTNARLSAESDEPRIDAAAQAAALESNESVNCTGSGDILQCTNHQKRPAGFGGYVAVDGLSAWKNEKVKFTNTGSATFTVASVQGLNVTRQQTDLAPGEVILERVDGITTSYGTLIFTDAATDTVRAKAEIIR
ncbi:MAG TPA: hypothetical protein VM580_09935 [Labilithrix sp.]|nr:hypothetical protein [Labilithrix sp.]